MLTEIWIYAIYNVYTHILYKCIPYALLARLGFRDEHMYIYLPANNCNV